MGLPAGTIRTMRHAHCVNTESNSAVQHYHGVTSLLFIELDWQEASKYYTENIVRPSTLGLYPCQ